MANDSLLLARIPPSDSLGQPAWWRRVEVLREAGRQRRSFNPWSANPKLCRRDDEGADFAALAGIVESDDFL